MVGIEYSKIERYVFYCFLAKVNYSVMVLWLIIDQYTEDGINRLLVEEACSAIFFKLPSLCLTPVLGFVLMHALTSCLRRIHPCIVECISDSYPCTADDERLRLLDV